jgi:hypothetical protein
MPSSYVNNLRLEEMATGEKSGTWGTITNTNLELIGEALGYGTEAIATDADTTITMQDATADGVRALYLKITSGVSLTATRTVTLAPNTVSKVWIIENATSGSQSIAISQGSGANVTIPSGAVKIIYTDGAGAGAAVTDALVDLDLASFSIAGTAVTSTAAELNILDGVTATTAELNYNDITTLGTVEASKTVTANSSGNVLIPDSQSLFVGTDSDLQIFHNGTNSYIDENGTGNLRIRAVDLDIMKAGTAEYMIRAIADGAVTLYYDNSAKLATATGGVTVTGTVTSDGVSVGDNEYIYVGAGNDLAIWHDGTNTLIRESGAGSFYIDGTNLNLRNGGGTATYANFVDGGAATLYYGNGAKFATTAGGAAVTGDLTATGNVTAYYSDDRLKTNLGKIENALEKVESLEGFYYEANETAQALGYKAEREVGISAQSVEKIMPEVVAPAPIDEQYLTVRYERLVPLLIESIKELSAEVKELRAKVNGE